MLLGSIKFVNSNYFYNHIKRDGVRCENFIKNYRVYCNADKITYYGTEINLGKVTTMDTIGENAKLESLDIDTLKKIQEEVVKKAYKNSNWIINKEKKELVREIISQKNTTNSNNKTQILENISKYVHIIPYIKKANKVLSDNTPPEMKVYDTKDIKFAAFYNNEIINYYTKDGRLVLREYRPDGETVRYQTLDSDGNFYTYDKDQKLVEYSKDNGVYNSKGELLYNSKQEANEVPMFKKHLFSGKNFNKKILRALNNPKSEM